MTDGFFNNQNLSFTNTMKQSYFFKLAVTATALLLLPRRSSPLTDKIVKYYPKPNTNESINHDKDIIPHDKKID